MLSKQPEQDSRLNFNTFNTRMSSNVKKFDVEIKKIAPQRLRQRRRDEIIDDEALDEYRSLRDEGISEGIVKLPTD